MQAEPGFTSPPIVLAFAASDPSGGAGIQADLLTLASMGCHPLSVITALTVQDTLGVEGILPVDADWVADQARALLEDMPVDAFKIGVLGSVENIAAIAEIIADYPDVPLMLDPVLASGRGDELATDAMTHALREMLLPQTTILTPNSIEVRRLADIDDDDASLAACAARLIDAGCEYVLITGTHEATPKVVNTLYGKGGIVRSDAWPRLPGMAITAPAARSRRRSRRNSRMDSSCRRRCARRRTTPGMHWRKPIARAWGSILPDRLFWARDSDDAPARRGGRAARTRCPRHALTPSRHALARAARIAGLYAVTPDLADTAALVAKVAAALDGGAAAIQYRAKSAPVALRHEQARALAQLCAARRRLFIVNDDAGLACDVAADGVHLGVEDGVIGAARARVGPARTHRASRATTTGRARAAQSMRAPTTSRSEACSRRQRSPRRAVPIRAADARRGRRRSGRRDRWHHVAQCARR